MTRFDIFGSGLLVASVIFCVLGLSQLQTNTEDVLQWLPDDSQARQEYNDFVKKFGSDDFLIATWNGCTIDDPRLNQLCRKLNEDDPDGLIRAAYNGAGIIDELESEVKLSKKVIIDRFKGIYFGIKDPNQTLALIELTTKGSAARRDSLTQIENTILSVPNLNLDDVIFGGYPYVGLNIDRQLSDAFKYLLLPSILFASIVSLLCLRNVSLSMIVFFTAIGASACSVAIVPLFGVKFGGLMAIIPALVYILATSGSIHLIRYSLDVIGDSNKLLSLAWRPCFVSTLTTAIGMLSLGRSSFPAIRSFGFFCATGAVFALVYQLIAVPWLLQRFGGKGQRTLAGHSEQSWVWETISNSVLRYKSWIVVFGAALMMVSAIGLFRLNASVDLGKLFDPNSAFITSLADLDSRIGPVEQSEFLIEFNDVSEENFHIRAKLVYEIQRRLAALPEVGATHALQNYLPREPKASRLRSLFRQAVYEKKLDQERAHLSEGRFLNIESKNETWRISLRFPFSNQNDVQQQREVTIATAKKYADAFLKNKKEKAAGESPAGVPSPHFIYTGATYLFHSAQLTLLDDLFRNFLMAFAVITPVLILVLRSLSLGLIAMLPNLFPIVVFFGLLGWFDWPVDLALAMTASVALGIAVDDTTHFLMRFREFGGTLNNVEIPLSKAITQCGPAMFHTTSIGAAGLIVYGCSDMPVVRNFCLAITAMLVLALMADIFWLPAILGFGRRKSKNSD